MARGATIGRYVVLGLVGRGGMGDVYAAYDPELDRKIAVKLLRAKSTAGQGDSEGRTRLLREAQAIAKLSHANVVVVYDVGTFEDTVFIAMEFIEGDTVRYWLHAAERGWRDVLRVFVAAGRGLAAAHEAGIVHRDFKPDNVMVGRDGKVRVMDFGLARQSLGADDATAPAIANAASAAMPPPASPATPEAEGSAARQLPVDLNITRVLPPARSTPNHSSRLNGEGFPSVRALDTNLTQTGAMLGTPAYMAPEQFASKVGDARTDQFSFCVSLYESLYGERPFVGKSFMALMSAVVRGEVQDAPAGSKVPAWIRKVLLRGLHPEAAARYPSMTELLHALESDPSVARRRWTMGTATALLAATVAFGASRKLQARHSPCEGGAAKLAGIWEPGGVTSPRKRAIHAAFRATGKSYAERTFETVSQALEKYTAAWTATYTDACQATAVRGDQSAEALDLRMSCLRGRLDSVKALTDVFVQADGQVVERAVSAVGSMPFLDDCSDVKLLRATVKPPDDPAVRARVQALRPRIAEVKALSDAGRVSEALKRAGPLAAEARALGYAPLTAEALLRLGWIDSNDGQPAEAESILGQAIWNAEAGGDAETFAEAAILQVYVVGYVEGQVQSARQLSQVADATLHRIGGHDILRSWLLNDEATLFDVEGRHEESLAKSRASLALKEKILGPDDLDVATGLGNLAEPLAKLGRFNEALEANQRALQIYERTLGIDHPNLALYLSSRGEYLNALSRFSEAEVSARRAQQIWEHALGPNNSWIGYPLTVLGISYLGQNRARDAIPYLERAYAIRTQVDPQPSRLAETSFALAQAVWQSHGHHQRAQTLAEEALHEYEKTPEKQKLAVVKRWIEEYDPQFRETEPAIAALPAGSR